MYFFGGEGDGGDRGDGGRMFEIWPYIQKYHIDIYI